MRLSSSSRKTKNGLGRAITHFAIIFITVLLINILAFVEGDDCRIIHFREERKNTILTNHAIKSDQVTNQEMCKINCYMETKCVSYNYGPLEDGSLLCEINDKNHLQVPSSEIIARSGFIYSPVFTFCQSSPCVSNATCQEGFGDQGYRCVCPQGYYGDKCQLDIDECILNTHDCSSDADCSNDVGSFQCTCFPGFTGDGKTCQDIDECTLNTHDCSPDADCSNDVGSFKCTCKSEFTGDGQRCEDIDECILNTHDCSSDAACSNDVGSFQCTCNPGFTGDGKTCEDINECSSTATNNCDQAASCTNTDGSFQCTCRDGYSGDGTACQDVNECTLNTHDCSPDADCSNDVGSFHCTCKSGFTGDGQRCEDIDECALNTDDCSSDADCSNDVGSFQCTCNPGFTGDGKTCEVAGSSGV
ncbi:uncharacterized protein LOC144656412 [Oculina patagonica]